MGFGSVPAADSSIRVLGAPPSMDTTPSDKLFSLNLWFSLRRILTSAYITLCFGCVTAADSSVSLLGERIQTYIFRAV